jgi:hypothetical protein
LAQQPIYITTATPRERVLSPVNSNDLPLNLSSIESKTAISDCVGLIETVGVM